MSEYVEVMQLRRLALLRGDEKTAAKLWEVAQELEELDLVTEDDRIAAAYL